jgi:ATP-dependent DNA ligase
MSRVVKRSASQAVKFSLSRRDIPLPQFVPPQLSKLVENPPSGPQWLHEIKLDGSRRWSADKRSLHQDISATL